MRGLLLALPFALLPLVHAQAANSDDAQSQPVMHASLGTHEHGVARLNVALDGTSLELELESPAMNMVGFEHMPGDDADRAKIAAARALLQKPLWLFSLPANGACTLADQGLQSPLFNDAPASELEEADPDDHAKAGGKQDHHHSEIHAHYSFTCTNPAALKTLDLTQIFSSFPATQKIQVQLIGPNGQQGADVLPDNPRLSY